MMGQWWAYSPESKGWAKVNAALAHKLRYFMEHDPKAHEGWKVAYQMGSAGFLYIPIVF